MLPLPNSSDRNISGSLSKGALILVLFISFFQALSAQGDLLITPRRVVFEGSRRSIDLNLANTGKDTATYAISLIQIRMTAEGAFETITEPDPGQNFADRYIRFFPRQVTLGPNEAQVVKVQMLRSGELKPGEYRSHFYFRAVPKPVPLGEKATVTDESSISVVLTPVYGITIPAIIRVGEPDTRVTLSNLELNLTGDTLPQFSMVFNRSGNMSAFGDLAVYHISTQGKETKVGIANGIAIYTPNTTRNFRFNLNIVPGVDYRSGTLRAIFSAPTDVRPERYAEAEVNL
jgi:P pilus assembly chaperone PapD